MIYTFFTSVFIAVFFVTGTIAFYGFLDLMRQKYPFSWTWYQYVIILAAIAALCFICACIFGAQIPECYATQF